MVRKNADIALGNYKIKVMKEREKNTVLDMMQEQLRLENVLTELRHTIFQIFKVRIMSVQWLYLKTVSLRNVNTEYSR